MIQKDLHIKQKICKFAPTDEIREISSIDQQLESKRKESIHAGEQMMQKKDEHKQDCQKEDISSFNDSGSLEQKLQKEVDSNNRLSNGTMTFSEVAGDKEKNQKIEENKKEGDHN